MHTTRPLAKEDPMQDMSQALMESLARQRESKREASQALWAMSADQRVAAMRRGELTRNQLYEWARNAPKEVPLLNGEFEFIAALTPEVTEAER
jgi:hypothetical protein